MVGVLDEIKALLSPAGAWLWAELGKMTTPDFIVRFYIIKAQE